MKEDGITLIELIVVVTIIGILAIALGFSFQGWIGGYRVESQVKEMYVDLMNARTRAMQRNIAHFVLVTADNYQILEDTNGNGAADIGTDTNVVFTGTKPLQYPSLSTVTVTLDTGGLVSNDTIQFNIGTNNPDYDCIVLAFTRINIGRWESGNCVAR